MSKVKVKFLKHVASPLGSWKPNEIAELDETLAKQICTPIKYEDRNELFVKAIILETKADGTTEDGFAKIPIAELSVGEMLSFGLRNVVTTPPQPEFDEQLKKAGFLPTKENDKRRAKRLEKEQLLAETQTSD